MNELLNKRLNEDEVKQYRNIVSMALMSTKKVENKGIPPSIKFSPPARENCKRFLLKIANGDSNRSALKTCGLQWTEISVYRLIDQEFNAAYKWVESNRRELLLNKATDTAIQTLDNEEVTPQAGKMAQFVLERLDKPNYSRELITKNGGSSSGTTININIMQPTEGEEVIENEEDGIIINTDNDLNQ